MMMPIGSIGCPDNSGVRVPSSLRQIGMLFPGYYPNVTCYIVAFG